MCCLLQALLGSEVRLLEPLAQLEVGQSAQGGTGVMCCHLCRSVFQSSLWGLFSLT